MRVQKRLTVLFLVTFLLFFVGLWIIRGMHKDNVDRVLLAREQETDRLLRQILDTAGVPLQTFAYDYTYWDEMADFVDSGDPEWASANLDVSLATFDAQALWVYDTDGNLVYRATSLDGEEVPSISLDPKLVRRFPRRSSMLHFYQDTPVGLMEVRGATIHTTDDPDRTSPPRGSFFVARLWDQQRIAGLVPFESSSGQISSSPGCGGEGAADPSGGFLLHWCQPLPGWDGQPVASLRVTMSSPLIKRFIEDMNLSHGLTAVTFTSLLILLTLALVRWIGRPLRTISTALGQGDVGLLESLQHKQNEFGEIARSIGQVFKQQDELVGQMAISREAEKERLKLEAQLRQAQRLESVGRLAGGVAHGLNNLLTPIIGYSETALLEVPKDQEVHSDLHEIREAAIRSRDLVHKLLAFSRLQVLDIDVISLQELLDDLVKLLRRTIREDIDIQLEMEPDLGWIEADMVQVEQIFLNLAVNAQDAMPHGGVLTIKASNVTLDRTVTDKPIDVDSGHYVLVSISDTGTGMDQETQQHLFEPFFTTKEVGKGTGLGLATAYGIAKQHRGHITFESEEGRGTTFRVVLPRASEERETIARTGGYRSARQGMETVLLVDDEPIVSGLVHRLLTQQGYTVLTASGAEEAIAIAGSREGSIDLLLTDVIMPRCNGPRLYLEIRASRPNLKVLYMSGHPGEVVAQAGVSEDHIAFISKPFSIESMIRKVREVLESDLEGDCLDSPAPNGLLH